MTKRKSTAVTEDIINTESKEEVPAVKKTKVVNESKEEAPVPTDIKRKKRQRRTQAKRTKAPKKKKEAKKKKQSKRKKKVASQLIWSEIEELIGKHTVEKGPHLIQKASASGVFRSHFSYDGENRPLSHWIEMLKIRSRIDLTETQIMQRTCEEQHCVNHSVIRQLNVDSVVNLAANDIMLLRRMIERNSRLATAEEIKNNIRSFEQPCRVWTGIFLGPEHPWIHFSNIAKAAYQVTWELENNTTLPEGKICLHLCKTKTCVEPQHIYPGTYQRNNKEDRERDGTALKGEKNPCAKISDATAKEIYLAGIAGESAKKRASRFGAHIDTVRCIDRLKQWSHVLTEEEKKLARPIKKHKASLNNEVVRAIRREIAKGIKRKHILDKFGISGGIFHNIKSGKTYQDVLDTPEEQKEADDEKELLQLKKDQLRLENACEKIPHETLPDPCWIYQNYQEGDYGSFSYGTKTGAHVASYLMFHGEIPEGMVVRHKCGNTLCCAKEHLEVGTYSQNNGEDRLRDGTLPTGETHSSAKVTLQQVRGIRAAKGTYIEIAKQFNTNRGIVAAIRQGKTWRHFT